MVKSTGRLCQVRVGMILAGRGGNRCRETAAAAGVPTNPTAFSAGKVIQDVNNYSPTTLSGTFVQFPQSKCLKCKNTNWGTEAFVILHVLPLKKYGGGSDTPII